MDVYGDNADDDVNIYKSTNIKKNVILLYNTYNKNIPTFPVLLGFSYLINIWN